MELELLFRLIGRFIGDIHHVFERLLDFGLCRVFVGESGLLTFGLWGIEPERFVHSTIFDAAADLDHFDGYRFFDRRGLN